MKQIIQILSFIIILFNKQLIFCQQQLCLDFKAQAGTIEINFEGTNNELENIQTIFNHNSIYAGLQYRTGKYLGFGFYLLNQNYKWKISDNHNIALNNGDYSKVTIQSSVLVQAFAGNINLRVPFEHLERIHWLVASGYQFGQTIPMSNSPEYNYHEPEISILQSNVKKKYSSAFLESGFAFGLSERVDLNINLGYNYSFHPVYECNYSIENNNLSANSIIRSNLAGIYLGSSLTVAVANFKKKKNKKKEFVPEFDDNDEVTAINGRAITSSHEIKVKTSSVEIQVWDYGREDGDKISLFLNSKQLLKNFKLSSKRKNIVVNLKPGINKLIVYAHNLGKEPPNTSSVIIDDGIEKHLVSLESTLGECGAINIYSEQ